MPRKYAKKRPARRPKRSRYTKRRNYKKLMYVPSGMPKTTRAKLRYCDTIQITAIGGTPVQHVFRANSIYDPNYSGTGHQPMGHDTWATMFNHYTVTGSKISIQVIPDSSNATNGRAGLLLQPGPALPYTNVNAMIEAKMGSYRNISHQTGKASTMVQKFSSKRFFNVQDVKDVGKLGAAFGADPSEEAYFLIWYADQESATTSVRVTITIDFIVQFSEPKHLPQS